MKQKKLAWAKIVDNDELLAKMWNKFVTVDEEVAKEAEDYGERYMKIYPNTFEGISEAYSGEIEFFIKDNLSFWGNGCGNGYEFQDKWFKRDVSTSEEEFVISDDSVWFLIESIIDCVLNGTIDDEAAKKRFRKYCVEHQNEFKELETE